MATKKTIQIKGEECKVFKRPLPVELTPEELNALGDEAGKLDEKIEDLEAKLKEESSETKKKIKETKAKLKKVLKSLASKEEDREVECAEFPVWSKNRIDIYRIDGKEPVKVEDRTMRPEEKQVEAKGIVDLEEAREKKGKN